MQLPAAQTSLEPQPHRVDPSGRKPYVSQNANRATAADYRASPPSPTPEDLSPQTPDPELNKLPIIAVGTALRGPAGRLSSARGAFT